MERKLLYRSCEKKNFSYLHDDYKNLYNDGYPQKELQNQKKETLQHVVAWKNLPYANITTTTISTNNFEI